MSLCSMHVHFVVHTLLLYINAIFDMVYALSTCHYNPVTEKGNRFMRPKLTDRPSDVRRHIIM